MNDDLYSKLAEMSPDDPRRVVPFDMYMTETLETSANMDFLGDDLYLMREEKDSLIRENQALEAVEAQLTETQQKYSKLVDLLRKVRSDKLFADTRPYRWDDDSLPFESPEGPLPTDL